MTTRSCNESALTTRLPLLLELSSFRLPPVPKDREMIIDLEDYLNYSIIASTTEIRRVDNPVFVLMISSQVYADS